MLGPWAEGLVWLLAEPVWHTALQVPQLGTGGQAGSAASVGRVQLLRASTVGRGSCLSSALLGVCLEAGAQLGSGYQSQERDPTLSRAHPSTSPALYELVEPPWDPASSHRSRSWCHLLSGAVALPAIEIGRAHV